MSKCPRFHAVRSKRSGVGRNSRLLGVALSTLLVSSFHSTLPCQSSGGLPAPLSLKMVVPGTSTPSTEPREPIEVLISGPAGMWVCLVPFAFIDRSSTSTISENELNAFYSAHPWSAPPLPTSVASSGVVAGPRSVIEAPLLRFATNFIAVWNAGTGEQRRGQPIVSTSEVAPLGALGVIRRWDVASPTWLAYPDSAPDSVQKLWSQALYAESNEPNEIDTNTTIFDPMKLADHLFTEALGSAQAYNEFLNVNAEFMITRGLEVRVCIQAFGVFSIPQGGASVVETATGPFEPTDPSTAAIFVMLSETSAVGFGLGVPLTGILHPGFIQNGVPIQPRLRPTFIEIPCRGAMNPEATLNISWNGTLVALSGNYLKPGWMRFQIPGPLGLPVGTQVTLISIQNSEGFLNNLPPGSPLGLQFGPMTVSTASL